MKLQKTDLIECECCMYKRSTADADSTGLWFHSSSKSKNTIHLCHLIAYDLLLINCDNMRVHICWNCVVLFYLDKLYWFYLCKCLEFNFKNSADTLYLLLLKLFSLAFRFLNIFFSSSQLTKQWRTRSFFRQHIFLLHLRGAGYLKKHKDCYFGSHLIPPAQFLLYLNDWIGFQFRSELWGNLVMSTSARKTSVSHTLVGSKIYC